MINKLEKLCLNLTLAAPTLFSLGLVSLVKEGYNYFFLWEDVFYKCEIPKTFIWWTITISFVFMILSLVGIKIYLNRLAKKEGMTIKTESYLVKEQHGFDQVISSIIPWASLLVDNFNFKIFFFCILIQCVLIVLASYNNTNFNLFYSILGYRCYEVRTENNTYMLLFNHCVKNKADIKRYVPITDYMGLLIKNK